MPAQKAKSNSNPKSTIQVLKEATCPTSSGKSALGYQVGTDDQGNIHLKIASNTGGGFFSDEWLAFTYIESALNEWPVDKPMTSIVLRDIHRGRSSNNGGFLMAILRDLGVVQPMEERKRCFELGDIQGFLAQVETLRGEGGSAPGKKPARKATTKSGVRRSSSTRKKAPGRSKKAT